MTTTPTDLTLERARLMHEFTAERIDQALVVDYLAAEDYTTRAGYPTRERVARWARESDALRLREQAAQKEES